MRCKVRERSAHRFQLLDLLVELCNMLQGQTFHLGARAPLVAPQSEQPFDFLHRETKATSALDESQRVQIILCVDPVVTGSPSRPWNQLQRFIVADHFRRDARGLGRLSDRVVTVLADFRQFTALGSCSHV